MVILELGAAGQVRATLVAQQKGSYSELMTIALVGDLLDQVDVELWFNLVKREYRGLFPMLSVCVAPIV